MLHHLIQTREFPVDDTTAVARSDTDETATVRLELGSVSTGTDLVWTVPNQNLDFTPDSGDFSAAGGGGALPVSDATAIVKDPSDATKLMRIDVGAVANSTTRVLTMPDADVDLTVGSGTFNKYVHPDHTGDVTSSADGAQTIAADAVTYAKMQDVTGTDKFLGRDSSGAGVVEEIAASAARTILNVEDGATADQSNAEVKTAYEANADTNEFSDAEQTKLSGIETSATADQSNAEIKTAYEANADTNEFSDAEQTKLAGVETSADVTDATNVAASGAVMDSDVSEGEGFLRKTGAGAYEGIKTNIGTTVAPTVNEDSGDGYAVGSRWIDTTGDKEYVCLDSAVGAAVWTETSGGGAAASSGFSGGTQTTSAIDITLTDASDQVQAVTMTAVDKKVTLPDSTTMTSEGAFAYVIINEGAEFPIRIADSAGAIITVINGGEQANISLMDNSSAAGSWIPSVTRFDKPVMVDVITGFVVQARTNSICGLTATKSIVIAAEGDGPSPNEMKARVCSSDGVSLSFGTTVEIDADSSEGASCITRLTDTKAIMFYVDYTNDNLMACVLDVSGTTITPGTPLILVGTKPAFIDCDRISDTSAIIGYKDAAADIAAQAMSVSGTTITPGTAVVMSGDITSDQIRIVVLSETRFIISYIKQYYGNTLTVNAGDLSGTTITDKATMITVANTVDDFGMVKLDADTVGFYYFLNTNYSGVSGLVVQPVESETIGITTAGILPARTITSSSVLANHWVDAIRLADHKYFGYVFVYETEGSYVRGNVIYHHSDGSFTTSEPLILRLRNSGSLDYVNIGALDENNLVLTNESYEEITLVHIPSR